MEIKIGVVGNRITGAKYSPPPFAIGVGDATRHTIVGVQADAGWHRWNEVVFDVTPAALTVTIDLEGMTPPAAAAQHIRLVTMTGDNQENKYELLPKISATNLPPSATPR